VTNWPAYDAALQARGSLTVWFTAEAIAAWRAEPRTTRGGQPQYSDLAIATALTLRAVFRLALRQTEGLIRSILQLLGLDLAVPDHSTMSRRARVLALPRMATGRRPVHLLVDSTGVRPIKCWSWDGRHIRAWHKRLQRLAICRRTADPCNKAAIHGYRPRDERAGCPARS
jgi:hypothetical protein